MTPPRVSSGVAIILTAAAVIASPATPPVADASASEGVDARAEVVFVCSAGQALNQRSAALSELIRKPIPMDADRAQMRRVLVAEISHVAATAEATSSYLALGSVDTRRRPATVIPYVRRLLLRSARNYTVVASRVRRFPIADWDDWNAEVQALRSAPGFRGGDFAIRALRHAIRRAVHPAQFDDVLLSQPNCRTLFRSNR